MAPPLIFDRKLLAVRLARAAAGRRATFLLDRVAGDLAERLLAVNRRFALAADLGTPADGLAHALREAPIETLIAIPALGASGQRADSVIADLEALPFREGVLDLAVSAFALQFVNDLPGMLIQVRRALKPDGLFLAAFAGGETLSELRAAFAVAEAETTGGISPRVAPFIDVRAAGALLQRAGFALPVADLDRIVVRYPSPRAVMNDLRGMGATNILRERRRVPLARATLARMEESYRARFGDPDGKVRATFDIVWLSGWAPHESQQKPLKPGSAAQRLAEALGTREFSAGEKPR